MHAFVTLTGRVCAPKRHAPCLCAEESSALSPRSLMNRRVFLNLAGAGMALGGTFAAQFLSCDTGTTARAADTGYLPKGAQTFQNIVGAQRQWDQIAELVSSRGKDLTEDEWDNLRTYLRQAYKIGNDMETYTSTVAKKDELRQLCSAFRKKVKEMDNPGKSKDAAEFYKQNRQVAELFSAFFAILAKESDMPDEL